MRVLLSGLDGSDLEGEVIGGESTIPTLGNATWKTSSPFGAMTASSLRSMVGWWTWKLLTLPRNG